MVFRCAFTIQSDTRYLAVLRAWLGAAARLSRPCRIPAKTLQACTLALIEAVDNAIFHAHRRKKGLPIRVGLAVRDDAVVLDVADCGRGVGRHFMVRPEAMIAHGRGLYLIHRLMHRVSSRRRGGRHVLTMIHTL